MADMSALKRRIAAVLHDPHGAPVIMNIFRAHLASDAVVERVAKAITLASVTYIGDDWHRRARAALAAIIPEERA